MKLIEVYEQQQKKPNLLTLKRVGKQEKIRATINIILMIFCWVAECFSVQMYAFFIKNLTLNVYLVGGISGISAFGFLLQPTLSRKINQ